MKAAILGKAEGKPGQVWHPVTVEEVQVPQIKDGEVLVKLHAAALNHREVFIRQSLYPGIQHGSVLGADGAGVLVSPSGHPLYNKAVLLSPEVGWISSTYGPDQKEEYGILGGTRQTGGRGTFAEYIVTKEQDVVECPPHLLQEKNGWELAAALPLAALTAYRACFTKAEVDQGQNVLITGIGGGVAIQALQFCVAKGANVYVTSSKQDKIDRAKELGAKGGVNYKEEDWPKKLAALLPKDRPTLDAVIDSAGGNVTTQLLKVLKHGARVAVYGQTTGKPHALGMGEILKNVELRGSTMGSFEEFKEAIKFASDHKLIPVVHQTYASLDKADEAITALKEGTQFGKVVVAIATASQGASRL